MNVGKHGAQVTRFRCHHELPTQRDGFQTETLELSKLQLRPGAILPVRCSAASPNMRPVSRHVAVR